MDIRTFVSASVAAIAFCVAAPVAQEPVPDQAPGYSWAASCRDCHQPVYEAWAKTKHASALDRLSSSEQALPCVGCHVTGPKTRITDGAKVVNRGVQCEACHGGSAAHAADPKVKTGFGKVPDEGRCVECHSDKSPKFKGFFYAGMAALSHPVK